jgi:hypothetical protein
MRIPLYFLASLSCLAVVASSGNAAEPKPIDFAHDVVPLLKKHCVECHGGAHAKGGFSINTRNLILDAEAVVPGKAAKSTLIELIKSVDPKSQMPPKDRPRLSAKERATLVAWVDQGLAWEDGFSFAVQTYEPPLRPRRPKLCAPIDGRDHPLDRIIDSYLIEHEVPRPAEVNDETFLRRVHLDVIGLLPTPQARAKFLADANSNRRNQLIQQLLADDIAYAEHWLTFWNDLLRNDYAGTGFITKGRTQISKWLYAALVNNKPYDRFVRELMTPVAGAGGFIQGIRWRGNVNASQRQEIQFAQSISQAFLGINLKCASCHDSFINHWTLEETYALAQVYSTEPLMLHRCDKPTGQTAKAAWLFPELGQIDAEASQPERLQQLAGLLTHPENGRFTRTIVNRIWHRLMGRGIVHPVDAMHTEPWSEDLLDYLAVHLSDNGYDLKKTIELIATSQAYQSRTPSAARRDSGSYVFTGPLSRRMTAEQFIDSVWQLTGAAPQKYDAPVIRVKVSTPDPAAITEIAVGGQWIWSYAEASASSPGGETIALRREFELEAVPARIVAAITCDNEYTLFVNGRRLAADSNWESAELVNLDPVVRQGNNIVLIVAKNGGSGPNPAGLFFEARIRWKDGSQRAIGSDARWQWTSSLPDKAGKFGKPPEDWKPAVKVANPGVWASRIEPQVNAMLSGAGNSDVPMVRASLLKADELMRALGRPNRDQIVTMRPSGLTTLEAIDLANGQRLADAIATGASRAVARFSDASEDLTPWLFHYALTRDPTGAERALASELLGPQPNKQNVEDLMWAVMMLPEFQLVR